MGGMGAGWVFGYCTSVLAGSRLSSGEKEKEKESH